MTAPRLHEYYRAVYSPRLAAGADVPAPHRRGSIHGDTVLPVARAQPSPFSPARPIMHRPLRKLPTLALRTILALGVLLLALPGRAQAQETYTFTVGALGGLGGSVDADIGDSLDNTGFQLDLGMVIQPRNHLVLRIGQLGLDSDGRFEDLTDAELTYATIGGEYKYQHSYYDSGIYLALGGYRIEGNDFFDGADRDDTAVGLALGVTGEFPISRWLSLQIEFSGHYADFEDASVFGMGHGGFVVHF